MEITNNPPKSIQFINEHGQIMEQGVEYEWLPIKCKTCAGFGHSMAECRKEKKVQWVRKDAEPQTEEEQGPGEHQVGKLKESVIQASSEMNKDQAEPDESVIPGDETMAETNVRETKLKGCKISNFMDSHFPNWDYHTSSIIEGRILVMWRRLYVKTIILEESSQAVHCLVKVMGVQLEFGVTFVYGLNSIEGKDKSGGKAISNSELADSINWLAGAHVEPLRNIGSYFTWSNNQDGAARIYSKIDHAVIQNSEKLSSKNFRFYNYWADHYDFSDLVLKSWRAPIKASGINAIFLKLLRLKHCLKTFNMDRLGDLKANYNKAKDSYQKRKAENGIVSYMMTEGQLVDNYTEVVSHFLGHFRACLGSPSLASGRVNIQHIELGPKLSVEQQSDIREEVCTAISNCFESGSFPSKLHETTLSLIPKVANPSRTVDYRPIACYSTLYKCMAKLLCKRLAVVLPVIVQTNQGAFIQGRTLAHNIMICQDLIKNYGRVSTSSRCAIKIYLSKAYDTVDWLFLEDLFKAIRFPMKFIGWVMSCVRSTTYFLVMNGRIQGNFKGEKGLRQGDPMSPLLFVLIMEYLSRSLQHAALNSLFRFHPMCKSLKLINLCFAEELLIFCKGTLPAIRSVKRVLDDFSTASGLNINVGKSQNFFGGVSTSDRTRISQEINLSEGSFPLRYLGVPMRPTKWRHADCEVLIQKFRLKIPNWASRHLSFAGRIQLINSRSKLHIPSWQKVCLPKTYGGLGFREGATWNQVVLAKYIWALSSKPDLLWVKWIHSINLKGQNFWNYDLKGDCSWYWGKLCHLKKCFSSTAISAAGVQRKFLSSKLYNSLLIQQKVEYSRTI
ncbi:uncharacterized protein LOC133833036 [Humulus lupulus]|uniref:uncharacterized protein LOC133833036 n=1 Tax=Humulus lupulus TaxID=3486 RepID=UPI002B412F2F|nr:uncharacterized protein LOC133833036 [Humulus lupulus]